jgi:hypothetical protein
VGLGGEDVRAAQRIVEDRIVQTLRDPRGVRRNEFTLSPDGQTLTVRVSIESPHLSAPLRYRLTYRRQ